MLPSLTSILSRLRLKHMQLLVAIEDHGSLHKAAKAISISQPGATKVLQEIEVSIGMPLFERTSKGIVANEAGRCVTRYSRLICNDIAHMREEITGLIEGTGGHIAVGAVMGAMPLLTKAVHELRKEQPSLSIEIFEDNSGNLMNQLAQGRLDLALCRPAMGHKLSATDSLPLSDEPIAVVTHIQHPLARIKGLNFSKLASYPWIFYTATMPMRHAIERELQQSGLEPIQPSLETSSAVATIMLLQQDPSLAAALPEDVARFFAQNQLVALLDIDITPSMSACDIVKRQGAQLTPAAHLLISQLYLNIGKTYDPDNWQG